LYYIFIKIEILLKLGPRIGPFDPRGPRDGGRPIYLVHVRSGTDWPDPLPMRAYVDGPYVGQAGPLTHP